MPILMIRSDNRHQEAQVANSEGIIVVEFAVSTAGHTARKLVFPILFGLI